MKSRLTCLVLVLLLGMTVQANAAPIDYIFDGDGTGTLNGTPFSGQFSMTYVGDTGGVVNLGGGILANNTPIGIFFATSSLVTSLTSNLSLRLNTDPLHPVIGFGQTQPSPVFFVEEGTANPVFTTYDLKTAFPLTIGTPSFSNQTFLTNLGNLTFTSISSMSFQAVGPAASTAQTPLPDALPMFAAALLGLAFIAYQRRRA